VLSVNDKTLVVVGYYGGYGGSFFANILRKSIDYNSPQFTPINDKNEYGFDTRVLGIERYTINTLMKAYDQGFDVLLNIKLFENTGNKEDAEFGKLVKRMYIDCYDNDRSVFCRNLTLYLKKRLRLKDGYNVINSHYSRKFSGFSIYDVYDKTIFFLLSSEHSMRSKHHLLFEMLMDCKKDRFSYPELIKQSLNSLDGKIEPPKPFDSCVLLDVGKLFLQTKNNGIEEIERILSESLNMKINLDKEAIVEYTNSNIKLLNNFLGIEIEDASFDDVKQAIKNKLKSLI
jgi:hypothetical protein